MKDLCFPREAESLHFIITVTVASLSEKKVSKPFFQFTDSAKMSSEMACIQVSQKTSKVVWYSHLFKNFPQFVVIHTVKGFSIVNEAEVDVFSGIPLLFL